MLLNCKSITEKLIVSIQICFLIFIQYYKHRCMHLTSCGNTQDNLSQVRLEGLLNELFGHS